MKRVNKRRFISNIKGKYKWANKISNIVKRRPLNRPFMQMNYYDLNKVFRLLYENEIGNVSTTFTNHDGFLCVVLFFRKKT